MAKWILGAILGLLIVNSGVQLGIALSRHMPDPDEMTDPSFPREMDAASRLPCVEPQTEREKQLETYWKAQLSAFVHWQLGEVRRDYQERRLFLNLGKVHSTIGLGLLALAVTAWIGCIRTCRRGTAPPEAVPRS